MEKKTSKSHKGTEKTENMIPLLTQNVRFGISGFPVMLFYSKSDKNPEFYKVKKNLPNGLLG